MCSENEDLPRFIKFFEENIKIGVLESTKAFEVTKGNVVMMKDEKAEAKAEKAKMKKKKKEKENSMADLEKMILAKRGNAFGGFQNYMEKKYGGVEDVMDMPDEAAFAKNKKKTKRDQEPASESARGKKKRLINKK